MKWTIHFNHFKGSEKIPKNLTFFRQLLDPILTKNWLKIVFFSVQNPPSSLIRGPNCFVSLVPWIFIVYLWWKGPMSPKKYLEMRLSGSFLPKMTTFLSHFTLKEKRQQHYHEFWSHMRPINRFYHLSRTTLVSTLIISIFYSTLFVSEHF